MPICISPRIEMLVFCTEISAKYRISVVSEMILGTDYRFAWISAKFWQNLQKIGDILVQRRSIGKKSSVGRHAAAGKGEHKKKKNCRFFRAFLPASNDQIFWRFNGPSPDFLIFLVNVASNPLLQISNLLSGFKFCLRCCWDSNPGQKAWVQAWLPLGQIPTC